MALTLSYAVTDHAAQGRIVHTGLAVMTGTEDRQQAYFALTRGTTSSVRAARVCGVLELALGVLGHPRT
jgi:hypothetical protein